MKLSCSCRKINFGQFDTKLVHGYEWEYYFDRKGNAKVYCTWNKIKTLYFGGGKFLRFYSTSQEIRDRPIIRMDLQIRTMFGFRLTHQPTPKPTHPPICKSIQIIGRSLSKHLIFAIFAQRRFPAHEKCNIFACTVSYSNNSHKFLIFIVKPWSFKVTSQE